MPINIPADKFEDYLIQKNLKERTVGNYMYYFYKFDSPFFNQETVSRFLSLKQNRNTNVRGFLINLQKFLKVNYIELGISPENRMLIAEVELPKLTGRKQVKEISPIPHEWIPKLEEALETEKEKLRLLVSYYCALRPQELMSIRITSFLWDKWKKDTEKMGECKVFGKGDKEGMAFVPSFLMKRVASYIKGNKFDSVDSRIFSSKRKNIQEKNRTREWQRIIHDAGIKSGYTKLDEEGQVLEDTNVHPHKLRHSYASYLLEKGMDIRKIQIILRHTSITSTQLYTHLDRTKLKEEISSILSG